MKKRFVLKLFAATILMLTLCVSAYAARLTSFPVTIGDDGKSITINDIKITAIYHKADNATLQIHYRASCSQGTGSPALYMYCYDKAGMPIGSVRFFESSTHITVPDSTTMFEIRERIQSSSADTYFHNKYINVYDASGNAKGIPDLQLPIYMKSGWVPATTMCASDGRTSNVSPLRVKLQETVGWSTLISIDGIESISDTKDRIFISSRNTSLLDLAGKCQVNCYSSGGTLLAGSINITSENSKYYFEAPKETSVLEFINKPGVVSDNIRCFYSEYTTVYAADGRSCNISELLVDEYDRVGWHLPITMYAADGRKLSVPKHHVAAYQNVGWYTYHDYLYIFYIQPNYNTFKAARDYNSIISMASKYMPTFIGTKHEASFQAMKTEAMDLWKKSAETPVACFSGTVTKNISGIPQASVSIRNLSAAKATYVKVDFDCYDADGNLIETNFNGYQVFVNMESGAANKCTWPLNNAKTVTRIDNIRILEVRFDDGSSWRAKEEPKPTAE